MNDILPGGYPPHHRFLPEKEGWYSQLLLKRCMEDRNPLLPIMEDKYKSRELVESKKATRLPKLYHWSEMNASIPWDDLPERCVIKTNHWSGDTLFLIDNAEVPWPMSTVNYGCLARVKTGIKSSETGATKTALFGRDGALSGNFDGASRRISQSHLNGGPTLFRRVV